jgi:hypothetical protein
MSHRAPGLVGINFKRFQASRFFKECPKVLGRNEKKTSKLYIFLKQPTISKIASNVSWNFLPPKSFPSIKICQVPNF